MSNCNHTWEEVWVNPYAEYPEFICEDCGARAAWEYDHYPRYASVVLKCNTKGKWKVYENI